MFIVLLYDRIQPRESSRGDSRRIPQSSRRQKCVCLYQTKGAVLEQSWSSEHSQSPSELHRDQDTSNDNNPGDWQGRRPIAGSYRSVVPCRYTIYPSSHENVIPDDIFETRYCKSADEERADG